MKGNGLYKLNAADAAVAVLILVISVSPLFSFNRQNQGPGGAANIYQDNKLVKQVNLGMDAVYGIKNMDIQVSRGRVRISSSDCPRQVCVHTGWISGSSQTIVCVPNKMLVEIAGGEGKYDAVSY